MSSLRGWLVPLLLTVAACRSQAAEPPPAPAHYELTAAPPGALGARAAGTDAAPGFPTQPGTDPDEAPADPEGSGDDAGAGDAAAPTPDADGGVAL